MTAVSLRVPYTWFEVPEAYLAALDQVVRDLEARPGIRAARPTLGPPLEQRLEVVLAAEGQDEEEVSANPFVAVDAVQPGHFESMGIPLRAGRGIAQADNRPEAEPVVVVDEVLANALWPGEDPLGKRINGFGHLDTWFTVVGVAAATRYRELLEPHPRAYYPLRRMGNSPPAALLVRAEPGVPVLALVRESFERADPRVRVIDAQHMTDILRQPTTGRRFAASVLTWFAVATLLLAALGIYGVFTIFVQERTKELGIRRALGAQRLRLAGLVATSIIRLASVGAVAGLVIGVWATRFVESLLFGVVPADPATLIAVFTGSLVLALVAGTVPAVRASSTEPAVALRLD
jgi:putative ABC transport system permease protein